RLIKIGLIFSVISPSGWEFFSEYMVEAFNKGTDELVMGVLQIAAGGAPLPADATPFYQLDKLGEFLINPETFMAIFGTFMAGPFGLGMGALLGMAFAAFIKMLIEALRLYAVCFVVRSLLLGLAPIFIVFLLFEKTKQMFTSWLNSLISTALQPILLFTFLAFFTVMMQSATQNMFSVELCYTEDSEVTNGTTNRVSTWKFRDRETGEIIEGDMTWQGAASCLARDTGVDSGEDCPEFPIKIVDVLTFLLLVFLCSRFAEVVDRVSNELAGTLIALDPAGKFDQLMGQIGQGGGQSQQNTGASNNNRGGGSGSNASGGAAAGTGGANRSPGASAPTTTPPSGGGAVAAGTAGGGNGNR
ncbi:MAG: type IV secretion system protein, partial [Rickettsiales bacterium]